MPKNREGFSTMRWNQAIVYVAGALMFLGVALSVIEPRAITFGVVMVLSLWIARLSSHHVPSDAGRQCARPIASDRHA